MTTPIPDVAVAGLLIPAPLAVKIIASLRANYPTLTDGKDDDAAVRAVLVYWITSSLETYEGNLVRAQNEQAVASLRAQSDAKAEATRAAVREAAKAIRENPAVAAAQAATNSTSEGAS